jgi:hypothetical protein
VRDTTRQSRASGNPWVPAFAETARLRSLTAPMGVLARSAALPGGYAIAAGERPAFEVVLRDGVFSPKLPEVPAGARSFVVLPKLKPGEYDFVDEFNPITGELKVIAK